MKNFFQAISKKIDSAIQFPELIPTIFNNVNRGFCKDLLFLKKELGFNFDAIIDVGAATGEYSKAAHYIFPAAKIYAFEPIPDSFKKLESTASTVANMKCFNLALSDEDGEEEFHLNEFSYSSSLLQMTTTHKEIFPFTKNETTVKVKTSKLDTMLNAIGQGRTFLKMDVQGAELRVLKGATNLLKEIDVIQVEVSFMSFYKGQPTAEDLIVFLKSIGFEAFLQVSPVFDKKRLLYSDFIFFK
jgi:FkbM family methyltransferase